jgi:hypothetical protein
MRQRGRTDLTVEGQPAAPARLRAGRTGITLVCVRTAGENNTRQGFFERPDLEAVVAALPAYLQGFTRFAYLTGWRILLENTLSQRRAEGTSQRALPRRSVAEGRAA